MTISIGTGTFIIMFLMCGGWSSLVVPVLNLILADRPAKPPKVPKPARPETVWNKDRPYAGLYFAGVWLVTVVIVMIVYSK